MSLFLKVYLSSHYDIDLPNLTELSTYYSFPTATYVRLSSIAFTTIHITRSSSSP